MMLLARISVNESTWTTITVGIAATPLSSPQELTRPSSSDSTIIPASRA